MNQNYKNTVIIGLGVTGFACAEYLENQKEKFSIMDSRENPPKMAELKKHYPHIEVHTGGFPPAVLSKADRIILSPGVAQDDPALVNHLSPEAEIISEIELFARLVSNLSTKPIVAITGSNGKSTVTTLVGEMAKTAGIKVGVGGNLGIPAIQLWMQKPDLYVLELSSFQLETTYSLKPSVATVLNLSPDHMDRYKTVEDYQAAKCRIFNGCEQIVFNREDPILPRKSPEDAFSFGLDTPKEEQDYGLIEMINGSTKEIHLARGKKALLPISKLKLFGRHNIANALAALALGESVGLPLPAMLSTLEKFAGLAHRCEWVREHEGVQWINDSKGTNVGATVSALQGLANDISGKWILIAGGLGKNADFSPLSKLVQQYCRAVILMGEAAAELETLFKPMVACFRVQDMKEAVKVAAEKANKGDGVLLSPACASLDMFRDFEDRGNQFKEQVLAL